MIGKPKQTCKPSYFIFLITFVVTLYSYQNLQPCKLWKLGSGAIFYAVWPDRWSKYFLTNIPILGTNFEQNFWLVAHVQSNSFEILCKQLKTNALKTAFKKILVFIIPGKQKQGMKCRECRITANLLEDSGECYHFKFLAMFKKISQNVQEDSREFSRRFREMLQKIFGNVQEDLREFQRILENSGFDFFIFHEILLVFIKFCSKLLRNSVKKITEKIFWKWKKVYTLLLIINLLSLITVFLITFFLFLFFLFYELKR